MNRIVSPLVRGFGLPARTGRWTLLLPTRRTASGEIDTAEEFLLRGALTGDPAEFTAAATARPAARPHRSELGEARSGARSAASHNPAGSGRRWPRRRALASSTMPASPRHAASPSVSCTRTRPARSRRSVSRTGHGGAAVRPPARCVGAFSGCGESKVGNRAGEDTSHHEQAGGDDRTQAAKDRPGVRDDVDETAGHPRHLAARAGHTWPNGSVSRSRPG